MKLNADKQPYPDNLTLEQAKGLTKTHIDGQLCETCVDAITVQLGKHMFYVSALCNLLDLNLSDVIENESKTCNTLGLFNLS